MMDKKELYAKRLMAVEVAKALRGDWASLLGKVIESLPKEEKQKINAHLARRQGQNTKALEECLDKAREQVKNLLRTPAEKPEKGQEIVTGLAFMEQLGELAEQLKNIMAMMELQTNDDLLEKVWEVIKGDEE